MARPSPLILLLAAACYSGQPPQDSGTASTSTATTSSSGGSGDTTSDLTTGVTASASASATSSSASTADATTDALTTAAGASTGPASTSATTSTTDASTGGPAGCGDVDYTGYCDGTTLVWCEDAMLKTKNCADDGRICVYQDDVVGYNCVFPGGGGFGYPVGDKSTSPAGGWVVTQVLAHYYDAYGGGHLAHDVAIGEDQTRNAPVYAVADGTVLYAGPNASSYVHVVLIEHTYDGGQKICSFYGHLNAPSVAKGQQVARGDQVATILDQQGNSHLHYVLLAPDLCAASAAASGALICGYDGTKAYNGVDDLSNEPAVYTALPNVCGNENYPGAFLSPTKFIDAHHF